MILVANKKFCGLPAGSYPIAYDNGNYSFWYKHGYIDCIVIFYINRENEPTTLQVEVVNPYTSAFNSSEDYKKNGDGFLWSEDFILKDEIIFFEQWPKLK